MVWWHKALLGLNIAALATGVATPTYMMYVQGDPEIRACEPPFFNAGVDAAGKRPVVARPGLVIPPTDWMPIEKATFRYGDEAWVMRNDMFINKVSGPVQRSFVSDDGLHIYTLPMIYPPKTTPSGRCSRANFAVPWPTFSDPKQTMAPGGYTYKVEVWMYKNILDMAHPTPFPLPKLTIVE